MGESIESLAEDTKHPLLPQDSDLIVGGYQVGQASYPLPKSKLTTANHLLAFVFGNVF